MKYLLAAIFTSLLVLATACSQAPPPTKSASDGIQVHGHWTVTGTNPDGTLDAVHEFDNELIYNGKQLLTALIAGETQVTNHYILASDFSPLITYSENGDFECQEHISENSYASSIRTVEATSNKSPNTDTGYPELIIAAVCTAKNVSGVSEIRSVSVKLGINPSFIAYNKSGAPLGYLNSVTGPIPSGPYSLTTHNFTEINAIPVVLNQKYAFNVVISFN